MQCLERRHLPTSAVSSDALPSLEAAAAIYRLQGCFIPAISCPALQRSFPPYTCQPGFDGTYRCMNICEHITAGDGAASTCVATDADCPEQTLRPPGYCPGSMICCGPH